MLKIDKDNFKNVIEAFQDQKHIKTWSGVHMIQKHNLLHRAATVPVIIDCIIKSINRTNDNSFITPKQHLDAMRHGMYVDLPKTILNDLSRVTKLEFPEYAKKYQHSINNEKSDLSLSNEPITLYLSKLGDILNSFFEAKNEFILGNRNYEILNAINSTKSRVEKAKYEYISGTAGHDYSNENFDNIEVAENIANMSSLFINNYEDFLQNKNSIEDKSLLKSLTIIDNTFKQTTVERWAKRLSLNDFTLLEHSARVTALSDIFVQLYKENNTFSTEEELNCFRYSLYHDYPEAILNDMPSPVKKIYPELNEEQKIAEYKIMIDLDLPNSNISKFIGKMSDILDCRYESLAEITAGNEDPEYINNFNSFPQIYETQLNKFKDLVPPELIKAIETFYIEPIVKDLEERANSNLKEKEKEYLNTIVENIIFASNSNDENSKKQVNKYISELKDSQVNKISALLEFNILNGEVKKESLGFLKNNQLNKQEEKEKPIEKNANKSEVKKILNNLKNKNEEIDI